MVQIFSAWASDQGGLGYFPVYFLPRRPEPERNASPLWQLSMTAGFLPVQAIAERRYRGMSFLTDLID